MRRTASMRGSWAGLGRSWKGCEKRGRGGGGGGVEWDVRVAGFGGSQRGRVRLEEQLGFD